MNLLKANDKGRALIVAYQADRTDDGVDRQGDMTGPDDLFIGAAYWAGRRIIRLQHRQADLPPDVVYCVGSFITGDEGYKGEGYDVPPKTWAVWLQFNMADERGKDLFVKLKSGELGGLSMGGSADAVPFVEVDTNDQD